MIAPELVEMLVCPETRQPVTLADEAMLARLNEARERGALRTRGGRQLSERVAGALVRQDCKRVYLIEDGIPNMLVEEAVEL